MRIEHEDGVVSDVLNDQTEALLALTKHVLVLAPLRQVAGDLAEANERSTGVAERGDHDVRPESGTVLPDAPTLVLHPALARRYFKLPRRLSARDVLGRVEDRKMPSDDLIGCVALEAKRALVPAQDVPGWVESEDGVVLHPLDEEPIKPSPSEGTSPLRSRLLGTIRSQ